ncbi:type I restriction endonuclease [Rothia koreensis]|jgi:hypothetical protein|uniref:type I restriction endonuclease n=1 Tax=Rothia koreensis TaxID=592378 RepID=UPI0037C998B1
MPFEDNLKELATKLRAQQGSIKSEEATKNAFIMPFISQVLGYDIFNPLEVVPEYTADHGTKKGEKVDYAIMNDAEVKILIECKQLEEPLNLNHASQLFRYFSVTNARIGILTNGRIFNFYSDLDSPNIMDRQPFLVLDLLNIDESMLPALRKITKEDFNLDSVLNSAEELKYVGALKRELATEFREPSPELVRMLMGRVSERRGTVDNLKMFAGLVSKASKQFLKERVNERLSVALKDSEAPEPHDSVDAGSSTSEESAGPEDDAGKPGVVTTEEELAGYQIVKAIACSEVKPQRITQRDSKSYFAILLDDNNRRSVARLHFNGKSKKYLGLFDENKTETRVLLENIEDIYTHAERIRDTVRRLASTDA